MFFISIVVHGKGLCLWQPAWSSTTIMFVDVPWVHSSTDNTWKSGGRLCSHVCAEHTTQILRRRACSLTGGPGWGLQPLIVPVPLSLITASSFFLVLVHSPSAGRRVAVAAEVMNAFATWWRRNSERKINSHWTDPLIQVSILGPCGCCEEISSVIMCSFLQMLS